MLEVHNVHAGYQGSEVLHGVSLEVQPGEAVVLLGPNGHGKTTLLRAITGLTRISQGEIRFRGVEVSGMKPSDIVGLGISHIPQGDFPFPQMTVLENLLVGAYRAEAWRDRSSRLDEVLSLFPALTQRQKQLARSLSGGERRMLALARGLMGNAKLLLVDEPSLGLAPKIIELVYDRIRHIRQEGTAILVVDESATHVEGLADRVYLMESGTVVRSGSAKEILEDETLLSTYLG